MKLIRATSTLALALLLATHQGCSRDPVHAGDDLPPFGQDASDASTYDDGGNPRDQSQTSCGDRHCDPDESCDSCSVDCGACSSCGDGQCDAVSEGCTNCPLDCGLCTGCPDGECQPGENCASCPFDCGRCSSCGNGVCEHEYFESCVDCPADCGECGTLSCWQALLCAANCLGIDQFPPRIDAGCTAGCLEDTCDEAGQLIGDFVRCAAGNLLTCGDIDCLFAACADQTQACFRAQCQSN